MANEQDARGDDDFNPAVYYSSIARVFSQGFLEGLAIAFILFSYGKFVAGLVGVVLAVHLIDWWQSEDVETIVLELVVPILAGFVAYSISITYGFAMIGAVYVTYYHIGPEPPEELQELEEDIHHA